MTMIETLDGDEFLPGVMVKMTLLTEHNGWAIVWMHDRYYLRHLACGGYIRNHADWGCLCKRQGLKDNGPDKHTPVDEMILLKFKLVTKGDAK